MKLLTLLLSMFMLISCGKLLRMKDDEFSISRRDYSGNELRIDGYYYRVGYKGEINDGYWFFHSGVLVRAGWITNSFSEMDDKMIKFINDGNYKHNKLSWGAFMIEGENIAFERWYPQGPYEAYVSAGKILNDTTFHITESYRMVNGVKTNMRERDEMYYFREFDHKPDSTNRFIK